MMVCPNCGSTQTVTFKDVSGESFRKCAKCPYVFGPIRAEAKKKGDEE
jgi:transcription initiation factor TFIIIB Brf1 subunit/transcription initiation factor TFIIB